MKRTELPPMCLPPMKMFGTVLCGERWSSAGALSKLSTSDTYLAGLLLQVVLRGVLVPFLINLDDVEVLDVEGGQELLRLTAVGAPGLGYKRAEASAGA